MKGTVFRTREVKTADGKQLAVKYSSNKNNVKYIETSPGEFAYISVVTAGS